MSLNFSSIDRRILQLALPSVINNITVPLLGLCDLAIVGHIGSGIYLAAMSVATTFFNVTYWLFGFLRMGSSGLTAQAHGANDKQAILVSLLRALCVATVISALLLMLQHPLWKLALWLISPSSGVGAIANIYFRIVIWGAPPTLALMCLNGWFIGMQDTRSPMYVAVFQNIVNVIVSLSLVFGLDMKMQGVALGTLIAQWTGLIASTFLLWCHLSKLGHIHFSFAELGNKTQLAHFFSLNRDIFLRTICLVSVNFGFTAFGARQGDFVLAANTLLMTFFTLFSYIMDGFAFAGEALAGHAFGANDTSGLKAVKHQLLRWGVGIAIMATVLFCLGGKLLIALLSNDTTVLTIANQFLPWACLIPVAGTLAFVLDGICIGLTMTHPMLLASFTASLLFFLIAWSTFFLPHTSATLANHALWLAFILYLSVRGWILMGSLGKKV